MEATYLRKGYGRDANGTPWELFHNLCTGVFNLVFWEGDNLLSLPVRSLSEAMAHIGAAGDINRALAAL